MFSRAGRTPKPFGGPHLMRCWEPADPIAATVQGLKENLRGAMFLCHFASDLVEMAREIPKPTTECPPTGFGPKPYWLDLARPWWLDLARPGSTLWLDLARPGSTWLDLARPWLDLGSTLAFLLNLASFPKINPTIQKPLVWRFPAHFA